MASMFTKITSYKVLNVLKISILLVQAAISTSVIGCDVQYKYIKNETTSCDYTSYEQPADLSTTFVDGSAEYSKGKSLWINNYWGMLKTLTLRNYRNDSLDIFNIDFSYNALSHLVLAGITETLMLGKIELPFLRISVENYTYSNINRLDDTSVNILVKKPSQKLVITNVILKINGNKQFKMNDKEFLNISGPWMPIHGQLLKKQGMEIVTLGMSNSAFYIFKGQGNFILNETNAKVCAEYDLYLATTNLYINNAVDMIMSLVNATLNSSCPQENVKTDLKYLRLNNNGFKKIDLDIGETLFSGLNILDLSNNILEYISPNFLKFRNLSTLDLASNNLNQMEQNSNFKLLFKYLKNLRSINLSLNKISFIPVDMFLFNKHLHVIDLSFNRISKVDFKIVHLFNLSVLDLRGNRIKTIEIDLLRHFDRLSIRPSFDINKINNNVINLRNNQIQCTCRNVAFLNWVVTRYDTMRKQDYPYCVLEDKVIRLDQVAVENSKYLCIKYTVIIATSTASAFLTIAIFGISLLCYIRRRRCIQVDKVKKLKRLLQNEMGIKYLIFLSFCGEDEHLSRVMIRPILLETIQEQVGCNRDLICVGDDAMLPGFPIREELYKLICNSYVFAVIVSNNFCESYWCETELREATYQNKPVIMFIVDHVDENLMTPYIKTLFHRYTRVKVTTKDNGVEFTPDLGIICRSILEHAVEGLV